MKAMEFQLQQANLSVPGVNSSPGPTAGMSSPTALPGQVPALPAGQVAAPSAAPLPAPQVSDRIFSLGGSACCYLPSLDAFWQDSTVLCTCDVARVSLHHLRMQGPQLQFACVCPRMCHCPIHQHTKNVRHVITHYVIGMAQQQMSDGDAVVRCRCRRLCTWLHPLSRPAPRSTCRSQAW